MLGTHVVCVSGLVACMALLSLQGQGQDAAAVTEYIVIPPVLLSKHSAVHMKLIPWIVCFKCCVQKMDQKRIFIFGPKNNMPKV